MKTTIYYYTATGNSLAFARSLAQALGDTELVPLARHRAGAAPKTERVGIIFPIHAWGPPHTVGEFIRNLDLTGVGYTFAVASCGGTAGGALTRLRRALRKRGGELNAGFIVRSAAYASLGSGGPAPLIEMVRRCSGEPPRTDAERLSEIVEAVKSGRNERPERSALLGTILGNFFHGLAEKGLARMDAGYSVRESCDGCGDCARVCPRGNVSMREGKPSWRHDCDFCGACATWCPKNAIGLTGEEGTAPRGHNPLVTAADMVRA